MNHWLLRMWTLAVLAMAIGAGSLFAQEDTTAATDSSWNFEFPAVTLDGPVHRVAVAPNGDIYIGGEFTKVNDITVNRIAKWNGTTWSALGTGIPGGSVHAIAFSGNDVYIGGNFVTAGSVSANNIARWNGSQWSYLGKRENEQGLDPTVTDILFIGNTMYVAGSFLYGGNNDLLNRIARWNSSERIFVPLEGELTRGLDDTVFAMVAQGGKIYVGGKFPNAGGATAARVAVWDTEAETWSNLGNGLGNVGSSDAYATTLAVKDSILYVGGSFSFAGGRSAKNVAKWNIPNGTWSALIAATGGNGVDSVPTAMTVDAEGHLYIGGGFMKAALTDASRIAKWDNENRRWSALASGLDGIPYSLAPQGKFLYVGGAFTKAGDKSSPYLARWYDSVLTAPEDTSTDTSTVGVIVLADNAASTLTAAPNPANGSTTISFTLVRAGECVIDIRNVQGETVATLVNERLGAGPYNLRWNTAGIPDGIYFCRLHCGDVIQTTKLVLMR